MGFDRIKTKHDYIVSELLDKLLEEIKKATPKKGFPYIEHNPNVVKYYPNVNNEYYDYLRNLHAESDLKEHIELLEEEQEAYNLETLEVPQFHNCYLDFALLLNKFNHYYPYNDVKHTFKNCELEMKSQKDHLNELFIKDFFCFPYITSNIKNTNPSTPNIYNYFTYPNDISENMSRFKQFTVSEAMGLSYEEGLVDNLKGGEDAKKLAIEIYENPFAILYPNNFIDLDFHEENILVYSDFIRMIHQNQLQELSDSNIHTTKKIIMYSSLYDLDKTLEEYDNWSFLNIELAGNLQFQSFFYENIEDKEKNVINNSFELLVFQALFMRYSILNTEFDTILENTRSFIDGSDNLTDSQLIKYLTDFYKDIVESKTKKLLLFRGLKLPKEISDLSTKLIITLLERKKVEYDKKLHEAYIINPNKSNIEFDDFIGSTKIPVRNKNHDTFLDKEETYLLMLLLKKENIFLEGVSDTLLQKITEGLTGYKSNQLRKLGNDASKIIKSTQREKYDKIIRLLNKLKREVTSLRDNKK